jgi:TrmH family RNA methyltransferase
VLTALRVTTRNARYQQWHALLTNRTKRQRAGEFLVHGVRPISLAVEYGWVVRALLYDADRPRRSDWAGRLLDTVEASRFAVAGDLMAELAEKEEAELIALVGLPPDELRRLPPEPTLVLALDRPASPGNIGTAVRSADAFGAAGVIVTGHAADPYEPRAVRASTGSLFAVPVVRLDGPAPAVDWARARGLKVVGTDEKGDADIDAVDLTGPTMLVIGAEATGLSVGWREACQRLMRIPIGGAASSLNAASAASITLYECSRQRRMHVHRDRR